MNIPPTGLQGLGFSLGDLPAFQESDSLMTKPQATDERWALVFDDERDFCRAASVIIGATFLHGPDAIKRLEWGCSNLFGGVTGHFASLAEQKKTLGVLVDLSQDAGIPL